MTKLFVTVAAAALLAASVGPTMAGDAKTDQVTKAPVQLTEAQMDQVVAGFDVLYSSYLCQGSAGCLNLWTPVELKNAQFPSGTCNVGASCGPVVHPGILQ